MEQHTLKVLEFEKIKLKLEDQAACALGREVAALTYPTTDLEIARRKQKETSEAKAIYQYEGNIPLGGIEDIRPSVERAAIESTLQTHELLAIMNTLHSTKRLGQFMIKLRAKYPLLGDLASEIEPFDAIVNTIGGAISQSGEVLDSASPALARVRSDLRTVQARLTERMNSFLQGSYRTIIQEPVITLRDDRYCIPVKSEHKGQFPGIVHDSSSSGATLFIEPSAVVELGNTRKQLAIKERDEIEKVLMKLSRAVGEVSERILAGLNVVGMIDCIVARAKLSVLQEASEPFLNNHGSIELILAKHPLLSGNVVPIDLTLGKKFNAILITGPNTGGKTVSLKTIGLLTIMAASGLHVPARPGTELAVFDQVFADIGDEQSIEQSLSTFSSHMNNIVRITNDVTANSLVLFDELGAGTDPAEGAALAKAILDHLLERGTKIVATTHYGELKEFAYTREGVQNASVEFDLQTLRPTYHLKIGIPGSSNAFAIAGRLGLDNTIIERARENLGTHTETADEIIKQIEDDYRTIAEEKRAAQKTASDAEALRQRYEEQLRRLEDARNRIEEKARARSQAMMDAYSKKLEATLEQLAAQKKDTKRAQDLKKKTEKLLDQFDVKTVTATPSEPTDEAIPRGTTLSPGTRVRIANVNQDGEIVEPPAGGKVVVLIGAMKVNVPLSSLRKARGDAPKPVREQSPESRIALEKAKDFLPEIHLIGMRVEPALEELDKYLDNALAAGADQVRIVHGKGTGQMRKAVWDYLRTHQGVKSYRIGEQDEGSFGVTIVKMKR